MTSSDLHPRLIRWYFVKEVHTSSYAQEHSKGREKRVYLRYICTSYKISEEGSPPVSKKKKTPKKVRPGIEQFKTKHESLESAPSALPPTTAIAPCRPGYFPLKAVQKGRRLRKKISQMLSVLQCMMCTKRQQREYRPPVI